MIIELLRLKEIIESCHPLVAQLIPEVMADAQEVTDKMLFAVRNTPMYYW